LVYLRNSGLGASPSEGPQFSQQRIKPLLRICSGRFPGLRVALLTAPSRLHQWHRAVFITVHSCGTAKESHLLPYYLPCRTAAASGAPEQI